MVDRIVVSPDGLRALALQLQNARQQLENWGGHCGAVLGTLDWETRQRVGVEGSANQARSTAQSLAAAAERIAESLLAKAQAFEEADREGADALQAVTISLPLPIPLPAPTPVGVGDVGEEATSVPLRTLIDGLDDLLKPINWAKDLAGGQKLLRALFEQIGRIMNNVGRTRGNIKSMGELGDILSGAQQTVDAASNLFKINDFGRFVRGEITNLEMARMAFEAPLKKLVPIPIVKDVVFPKIAEFLSKFVPDPNGHWHGLVKPAISE